MNILNKFFKFNLDGLFNTSKYVDYFYPQPICGIETGITEEHLNEIMQSVYDDNRTEQRIEWLYKNYFNRKD